MSYILEALRELRKLDEDYTQDQILSDEQEASLKKELDEVQDKSLNAFKRQQELQKSVENFWGLPKDSPERLEYDELATLRTNLYNRTKEIKKLLYDSEYAKLYFNTEEGLATDDDWFDALEKISDATDDEYEFEDLGVEVEGEWDDGDRSGTSFGTLDGYTLHLEPDRELIADVLHKKVEEVTKRDLATLDPDDVSDFIYENYFEEAQRLAKEDWDNGNIDWDSINWKDPRDYDDYY